MAHAGGRPLKFKSVEELQKAIDEYYLSCFDYKRDLFGNRLIDKEHPDNTKEHPIYIMVKVFPYTVTALASFLDTTRDTLMDYEKGKHDEKSEDFNEEKKLYNEQVDRFSDTIKKAKLKIYADTENQLFSKSATGAIFSLKNNYGWKDQRDLDLTSKGEQMGVSVDASQAEQLIRARAKRNDI